MSSSGWNVSGNIPTLNQLNDMRSQHRRQFEGILSDIESQTVKMLGDWEGAGWTEKDEGGKDFKDHYEGAQAAFDKMIASTDESASSWSARSRLANLFTK